MLLPRQQWKLARGAQDEEHAMPEKLNTAVAVVGIDIGKNSFHVVGLDDRGARRNVDLDEDVADVAVDGPFADEQLLRNRLVGLAGGDQAQGL